MSLLHNLRVGILRAADHSGVTSILASSKWRGRHLLILCYHGCSQHDEHEWNPDLYMSPALLRQRFDTIAELGYTVLPLQEGVQRLRDGTLPPKAVVLTFDDGAVDFSREAVPLLVEFNFPATVYVSTYYVDKRLPVFDVMLRYILWKGRGAVAAAMELPGGHRSLDLRSEASAASEAREIAAAVEMRSLDADDKEVLLTRIASHLGVDYASIRAKRLLELMTRDELAALPSLVSVQLHTHRHRVPTDRALFIRELADNRAVLAETRSERLSHFCYPSGVTHPSFPEWLRACDVETATTCSVALAAPDNDLLMLPRYIDTSRFSNIEFVGWLSGLSQWLPRRRVTPALAGDP